MPSCEGFQPPFDSSQEESYSPSSMFPKYEDHQQQHNMLMDNNKFSTSSTTTTTVITNGNRTSMNDSTMSTASTKNNTPTTEFKATFYNPFETKHRRRTSKQQFKILEAAFEENPKPSAAKRQALAEELEMTPRGVQIWFQNRRAKAKQRIDILNINSSTSSNNSSSNNKRSFDDFSSTLDEEDEYSTHQHRRRRTTSNYNKPFYTEWDSQEPIVTNDGTSTTDSTTITTNTAATTPTINTAAVTTITAHVTSSAPASPPCITGNHPVQAPSLCYSYSNASSSPVTPSVPSPTMQDQQGYQSQQTQLQPQLHSELSQQQQSDFLVDYTSKSMWSPMNDASFDTNHSSGYITDWMQTVPFPIRPSIRHDPSITSIATTTTTTSSGFGSEEDELLSQWGPKNYQIASFPNSPQQPQEQIFPQPIIHNTADNKENSIDLANIFGASLMDSTVPCNLLPVTSSDVHWISQNPQPVIW
ncbi:hypothetical protein INT45_005281 [Circinella minor]|uniref:Homeobox domain-containing protein n=1 Tax=Circinella minor TaxID=1195481 RepID=A0A8H7SAL8_9FUNG|nr:hypothetical protein INT45_005281 [Circinella minor]